MAGRGGGPLWAVIMAGGSGTRFWPVSRKSRPKQFLPPGGGTPSKAPGPSLLELTLRRLKGLVPPERTLVMASAAHGKLLRSLGVPKSNVVHEPEARNTAPCLGLAAHLIESRAPGALMCALPADHFIARPGAFRRLIKAGAALAEERGAIITLGLPPRSPETGFGYIERGRRLALPGGIEAFSVKRFREKPSLSQARRYMASGKYYWNGGVFILKAARMIDELRARRPRMSAPLRRAASAYRKRDAASFAGFFRRCESISVDRAVMEKARGLIVLPADVGWSDLGAWPALRDVLPRDEDGSLWMLPGGAKTKSIDSRNLIVRSNKRLVAAIGVEDIILVETEDALLVCSSENAQRIGEMVKSLNQAKFL